MGGPEGMAIEWRLVEKELPPKLLEDRTASLRGAFARRSNCHVEPRSTIPFHRLTASPPPRLIASSPHRLTASPFHRLLTPLPRHRQLQAPHSTRTRSRSMTHPRYSIKILLKLATDLLVVGRPGGRTKPVRTPALDEHPNTNFSPSPNLYRHPRPNLTISSTTTTTLTLT